LKQGWLRPDFLLPTSEASPIRGTDFGVLLISLGALMAVSQVAGSYVATLPILASLLLVLTLAWPAMQPYRATSHLFMALVLATEGARYHRFLVRGFEQVRV
jgi:hypothetical protein